MPKKSSPEPASILDAVKMLDTMTTDSSDSDSEAESHLYTKPRNLVQRRATITGASPTTKYGINIEQFWKELKQEYSATVQLRDKAASCARGLDNVPMVNIRPQTCLGLESTKKKNKTNEQTNKKVQFEEKLTDAKSTHPDDIKEKITLVQNSNDDGANIINKDINIKHLQASTDNNIIDSNNLNDTIVPLDEYNHSISDMYSINESMLDNKEIGVRHVGKRGKLDKNYSSAYDLLNTEKLDLLDCCLNNVPNSNLTKPDVCTIIENVEDNKKLKDANSEQKEESTRRCDSNVARKISDIEKQIAHENAEEQACAFGVPKRINSNKDNICVAINDVSLENSTEEKNQNDFEHDVSDVNDKTYAVERLSTECENVINKCPKTVYLKNSACECHENANCNTLEISNNKEECSNSNSNNNSNSSSSNSSSNNSSSSNSSNSNNSNSSDGGSSNSISNSNSERNEILQKFDKILQTVNCDLTQHAELLEKTFSSVLSKDNSIEMKISPNNNTKSIEGDLSDITHNILKVNIKQQIKEVKSTDLSSAQAIVQSCRYIELPKIESVRKLENKSHITPPEPPPRKYYTKQTITDLKLNNVPQTLENLEKPQIPERPGIKREFKKVDLSSCVNHVRSNSDCQDRKDSSDVRMLNYTENSMDFIDESQTISLSDQKFDRSNLSDASLYNESNDKQSREEKCSFEKYETFVEKFVCSDQSITDCYRFDQTPRNVDCPDGITHSKQTISSDLKPRLSEKDKSIEKSVVNRAMMVAKSIGLHSSLNKSNNSPRSNRKRNVLLASKYN